MADEYTKLADVIVPEIFVPYVIEKTAEKSKLLQSGIAVANPKLNQLVTAGGTTINMPFWQDLAGRSQIWTETKDIEINKIAAKSDIAALLLRANAWGATDLSGALAGNDPMSAIGDRVADFWARDEQKTLLNILKGVFASTEMSDHVLDKSTKGIDASTVLDAKQLLGDASDKLQAIAMHSAVYTELQKQNLIEYTTVQGPSGSPITIPTYLTYSVIVDDSMPKEGDVYTTYLFARGVIGRGEGTPVSMVPVETDRDSLGSKDILIHRRVFVMHPFGIKWKGTPELETPSEEELATGTNWERVYESKNIGLVALKHKIA